MVAAAATMGNVKIMNCIPKHLEPITSKLIEAGAMVRIDDSDVYVSMNKRPKAFNIKTLPYPGFPTDMQSQMGVVLSIADGTSTINESIWESRFQYTDELNKMGAHITAQGTTAVINGVESLSASPVIAHDLRAGAAMIIAGLVAYGKTEISSISHILRGYENIVEKFQALGADITWVKDDE